MEHHAHVNNPKIDPENAYGMGLRSGSLSLWNIIRVTPIAPRKPHHTVQHILIFLYMTSIYALQVFIVSVSEYLNSLSMLLSQKIEN